MIVKTFGGAVIGIDALTIRIETSIDIGINFMLVGLPDNAIKESHFRIATAIEQVGYKIPVKKIVINMAPADLKKEGSAYDLPLSIGILAASNQIPSEKVADYMMMGELSLDGELRPIKGALSIAIQACKEHFKGLILPAANAQEAAVVKGLRVFGVKHLSEVIDFFIGKSTLQPEPYPIINTEFSEEHCPLDFKDVKGQAMAKRAMEICATGGHNLLLVGPPGSGKTMLAKRLVSILPPLSLNESLETTKIHSVAGKLNARHPLIVQRPFRDPHHTISYSALVGGGSSPQPGEISLAHHGILFLDELPEFKRSTLEVLRQPLENRSIQIARSKMKVEYPAGFILVAAMNPCPCGYYNSSQHKCNCKKEQVSRYLAKISGPLLDRIDLQIQVSDLKFQELSQEQDCESSAEIAVRVQKAREIQNRRYQDSATFCNAQMNTRELGRFCHLEQDASLLLEQAMTTYHLSARAYTRILKVARSIADLAGSENIESIHLSEAIQYRCLDKSNWGS